MTFKKSFSAVLICLALSGASSVAADAQKPAAPKRGTAKARPQFFNPFDVKKTRLKINQYGFFTYLPAGALAESPAATAVPSSSTTPQVSVPPVLVTAKTTGSDAATASPSPLVDATLPSQLSTAAGLSLSGDTAIGSASASGTMASVTATDVTDATSPGSSLSLRPPFRPPVRSPFRPPPRPPF